MSSTASVDVETPSVATVLDKIAQHNTDVLGCVLVSGDALYHNLPEPYDLLDIQSIGDYARNIFALMEALDTDATPFEEAFLEFQGHSFLAQALDDGALLLVTNPVKRGAFRKMQLGVGLFLGPLRRALGADRERDAGALGRVRPTDRLRRIFGGLA